MVLTDVERSAFYSFFGFCWKDQVFSRPQNGAFSSNLRCVEVLNKLAKRKFSNGFA
jgi:hypothetical protein